MRVNQVNQRAEPSQAIPSMGGRQLADFLYRAARQLPGRGCVVECGSWLGASIAPVAEGMRDAGSSAVIHCFDRWRATREEVRKAAAQGVTLREGQDLLPLFMANILPIYPHIVCHQGWTREATWHSDPIELYIDDCNKAPEDFEHALATFGRAWKPEETLVVLMDYDFYRKACPDPAGAGRQSRDRRVARPGSRHHGPDPAGRQLHVGPTQSRVRRRIGITNSRGDLQRPKLDPHGDPNDAARRSGCGRDDSGRQRHG